MPTRTFHSVGNKVAAFRPAPSSGGGVRRILFVNQANSELENRYVAGSGVGSIGSSVRRALFRRASRKTCCTK
jgi:hypothetical protein